MNLFLSTETPRPKKRKTVSVTIPSNSVQESVRDTLKKDALLKARQEKAEKAEALKKSKQRVLEEMDSLLESQYASASETEAEEEETNLEDVPRNSKGHPTMAVKQPRKRRTDEEDDNPCTKCRLLEDELAKKNRHIKKLEEQLESLQSARSMPPSTSKPSFILL
ncbi:uncharacterized protein LOC124290048 [Haliotis rubra]|uniref:uncharacterized protein LOC124290048 n=1 Tax=Haliotis rubra TaxID=36100 RepID=UPI001EE504A9|nr:uncharacterized protein LOC124290048 [Haliotis rubra]